LATTTEAAAIRLALVAQGMLDMEGRIQPAFNPRRADFKLVLLEAYADLGPLVIDLLSSRQIERHVRRERDDGPNRLKRDVMLSPEFRSLWDRIKPKTTYRVEFATDDLVRRAVDELRRMEPIEAPSIRVAAARIGFERAGITTTAMSTAQEQIDYGRRAVPDLLAYLQNETELTRSTLARVLLESGRLGELFNNPQRFMDAVAAILKHELHRLLVDGIKYERSDRVGSDGEWEMILFRNEELINYLSALPVSKSVYDYVAYDSEVERSFARRLDERDDIKLFVKLPGWFQIDTPLGKYNPDWAILKDDGRAFYLVRETKGTHDFMKLRTSEADKVRCGLRHFDELGVPFGVVVTADEV
jgi:type III restriction enzyme